MDEYEVIGKGETEPYQASKLLLLQYLRTLWNDLYVTCGFADGLSGVEKEEQEATDYTTGNSLLVWANKNNR